MNLVEKVVENITKFSYQYQFLYCKTKDYQNIEDLNSS